MRAIQESSGESDGDESGSSDEGEDDEGEDDDDGVDEAHGAEGELASNPDDAVSRGISSRGIANTT
jgi:hypothetical protein